MPHVVVYLVFVAYRLQVADTGGVASSSGGGPSSDPSGLTGIAVLLALLLIPLLSFGVTASLAFRPWQRVRSGFLAGLITVTVVTFTPTLLSWMIAYVASVRDWLHNLGYG